MARGSEKCYDVITRHVCITQRACDILPHIISGTSDRHLVGSCNELTRRNVVASVTRYSAIANHTAMLTVTTRRLTYAVHFTTV